MFELRGGHIRTSKTGLSSNVTHLLKMRRACENTNTQGEYCMSVGEEIKERLQVR